MTAALLLAVLLSLTMGAPFDADALAPGDLPGSGGVCDIQHIEQCINDAYDAANRQADLTWLDIVAISYAGELKNFEIVGKQEVAYEALWRNFFDPQSGACPGGYNCTSLNLLHWLEGTGIWRVTVSHIGGVNTRRLLGSGGEYRHEGIRLVRFLAEHPEWKTGQAPDKAGQWGSVCLAPGTIEYPQDRETLAVLITHVWQDGYTFGSDLRGGQTPLSSYASFIVTSEGRRPISLC